jgi:hypothetical protein
MIRMERCGSIDARAALALRRGCDLFLDVELQLDTPSFQNRMQGNFTSGYLGMHSARHYTIGGDAGSDFFNSPSDPVSAIATMLGICDIRKNLLTSP